MIEIALEYDDFRKRVDMTKPIHYNFNISPIDKFGSGYQVEFNLVGLEKNSMWIIKHQQTKEIELEENEQIGDKAGRIIDGLVFLLAKPLGATLGDYVE